MPSTSPVIDDRIMLGLLVPLFMLPLIHPLGFVLALAIIPAVSILVYGVQQSELFLMLTLFAPVLKASPLNPIPPALDLTVLFYALFLAVSGVLFLFQKRMLPRIEVVDLWILLFTLTVLLSFFHAPGKVHEYSQFKLIRFLLLALPFFFFPRLMRLADLKRFSLLVALPGSTICLLLFLVYPDSNVMKDSGNSYLTVAAIAGIALFFAATRFVQESRARWKLVYLLAMIVDLMLVFKTNSRGGMLFGGLVLLGYFLVMFRQKHMLVVSALVFLGVATFLTYSLYPDFFARFFLLFKSHKGSSVSGRFVVYQLALRLISQRWLTGIGLGGFSAYHFLNYPHNLILEVFVEHGIAGFLAFMGILAMVAYRGLVIVRRGAIHTIQAPYLLAALFMLLFEMTSFGLESTRLFFFFSGCVVAFYRQNAEHTTDPACASLRKLSPEERYM